MKILIVTDDHSQEDQLDLIVRAAGHSTVLTDSGEEALGLLRTYECDAVIVCDGTIDLTPTMTVRQMRDAKLAAPIIVLSVDADVDRKCRFLNLGADDYIVSPVHRDELIARLGVVVRRAEGSASNVIEIGPLSVDLRAHHITVYGRRVHLTGTERRIAELLARRVGQTVTKAALMNALYDDRPDDPEIKIIDVFVCKLRKKLKDAGLSNFIQTTWGVGYRIDAPEPAAAAA